jgi:hypothetical protein
MSALIDIWTYEFARIRERAEERSTINTSDSGSLKQSLIEMFSVKNKQDLCERADITTNCLSEGGIWMLMNRVAPT